MNSSIENLIDDCKLEKAKRPLMSPKMDANTKLDLGKSIGYDVTGTRDMSTLKNHNVEETKDIDHKASDRFVGIFMLLVGFLLGTMFANGYSQTNIYDTLASEAKTRVNLMDIEWYSPRQLHLSMGQDSSEIYVTWATLKPARSYLMFCKSLDGHTCPNSWKIVEAEMRSKTIKNLDEKWLKATGKANRTLYSYSAKMYHLQTSSVADVIYLYKTVTYDGPICRRKREIFSATYQYLARNLEDTFRPLSMALYGDLGLMNGQSIPRLIRDVDRNMYDAIIHNGDFAYDLDSYLGETGDRFMHLIEPIAARVPYQTSVGNHEVKENFTHYDHRFTMINSGGITPGRQNNFYYSFNMGPIHFVSFSTEFYYFLDYSGIEPLYHQYEWLKKDLAFANSPAERAKRPWIIVFGHRPMYCSSSDNDDCTKSTNILRKGLPFVGSFALEKLFYENGVDVEFYSHEHQYERFLPLYNGTVYNGTDEVLDPYNNPRAPVHIISGSAGCSERLDPFMGEPATGSVKRISDYGYTRLSATRCSLYFEQVSDDKRGTIVDEFIITKSRQNFPIRENRTHECYMEIPALA